MTDSNPLSISVVEAIARAENKRVSDLDFRLNDHVDPEILDRLQTDGPREWSLQFALGPHRVSVDHDGRVTVRDSVEVD